MKQFSKVKFPVENRRSEGRPAIRVSIPSSRLKQNDFTDYGRIARCASKLPFTSLLVDSPLRDCVGPNITGNINGRVTDPSGAVVVGVQ